MGWSLEPDENWQWWWSIYNSAYGAVVGSADTAHQASVRMLLAEHELFERPLPKSVAGVGDGVYLDQPPCLECGHWMQRELVPGGEMLTCVGPQGCGARFWLDRWPYEPLERAQGGSDDA